MGVSATVYGSGEIPGDDSERYLATRQTQQQQCGELCALAQTGDAHVFGVRVNLAADNPEVVDIRKAVRRQIVAVAAAAGRQEFQTEAQFATAVSDQASELFGEPVERLGWPGETCLLYTSPSPRDQRGSRMPSSA